MFVSEIAVFAALCGFALVNAGGPVAKFSCSKLNVETLENSMFGAWAGSVKDGGVSMTIPIKSELPKELLVKVTMTVAGTAMPEIKTSLCEVMKEQTVGEDITKAGKIPGCPVPKGVYEINGFFANKEKMGSVPDGRVVGKLEIFMPDEKPVVTLDFEGDVSHELSMG